MFGFPISDILLPPKHQALDYAGMNIIETLDHEAFTAYLKKYGNTICGRNPIGVLLGTIAAMRAGAKKTRCLCDVCNKEIKLSLFNPDPSMQAPTACGWASAS